MVKVTDPIGPYQTARQLADLGLQVLPARYKHEIKSPVVKWRPYKDTPITDRLLRQWFSGGNKNYWVLCGKLSGVVVLDTDSAEGEQWWRSQEGMADLMDRTACVKTSKGHHYWFRIPSSWTKIIQSWAVHPETNETDNISFDFRAEGGGVIAPPSVHETGHVYAWTRPFSEILEAPEALLSGQFRDSAPAPRSSKVGNATPVSAAARGAGGVVRSLLTGLLQSPPAKGGRNDWMARVAGHYASHYRGQEDLFWLHCSQANSMMGEPLEEAEFTKTCQSLWDKEHGKADEEVSGASTFKASDGWIRGTGRRIFTQVRKVDPETGDVEFGAEEWADFDIKAMGISVSEDGDEADYWVRVFRDVGPVDAILPGRILGDTARLNVWLTNLRVSILPPDNIYPRGGGHGTRILRYLESQKPTKMKVAHVLGWDDTILQGKGGFITHEGVMTADGIINFETAGVRPDPALQSRGVAAHHYGRRHSRGEARRVLREVLTFQQEELTSVFGAWWAACLLKPQIQRKSSLFPFMAIEAPSESGKTNGFFDLMVQMNGNTRGETVPTFAALRSMTAAHSNGIVWIDDLDNPQHLMELLRAATSNGTITKMSDSKSGSWTATSDSRMVAPIVLSGESLGINTQKALVDRAVTVNATSPTDRMSLHDPKRKQWDDVLALREKYPNGLSAVAGWLVELALQHETQTLAALKQAKALAGRGRNADKNAILLAGARLLDCLTAHNKEEVGQAWSQEGGAHYARVLAWVGIQQASYRDKDNTLTQKILPWALRRYGWPEVATYSSFGDHTPAYIENAGTEGQLGGSGPVVWFNVGMLAAAWARDHGGRIEARTEDESGLRAQTREISPGRGDVKRLVGGPGKPRYSKITGEMAAEVIERSH